MSDNSPELHSAATEVLEHISRGFAFDSFVHYVRIGEFSVESGIPLTQWEELWQNWNYSPGDFLRENGRGNCVDFAVYGKQMLKTVGIEADVIGKTPDDVYTPAQKSFMVYRHASLLSGHEKKLTMYEPGWKAPRPIPLSPIGQESVASEWKFKTLDLGQGQLAQQTTTPFGRELTRHFDLQPFTESDCVRLTKSLVRIPRNIEMLTSYGEDKPQLQIRYNTKKNALMSNTDMLPELFIPEDIPNAINEKISDAFGFDVKEELLASLAVRNALPDDYWVR